MTELKNLQNLIKDANLRILDTLYLEQIDMNSTEISHIAYHTQKATKDSLFVCVKGYKTDGHKYLGQAVANGAAFAIVEDFQQDIKIPQFQVENARIALARLGCAFYNQPSEKMKVVGITATNGKTTTAFMTNAIFEKHNLKTGLVGTVVVKIDDESIPSDLTTPESLDLQSYFAQMVDKQVSHVCMEVSSAALEMHRVEAVDYDIVTINNIGRDHIDLHGNFEQYFKAKSRLITEAKAGSWAVVNLDDPNCASLINKTKANVLTYGINNADADLSVTDFDLSTGRAKFNVAIQNPFTVDGYTYEKQTFHAELSVPGFHTIYNSMMSIIISLLCQVPIETIQAGLMAFEGVERRFEFIFEDNFKIVDDHFANSGNIDVTFETMKYMKYNKLRMVYAIRGSRGVTVNRENAESIVKWSKILGFNELIATKSSSLMTVKDVVTPEEEAVFMEIMNAANIKVTLFEELDPALEEALSIVQTDDVILLAGCQGMDFAAPIVLKKLQQRYPTLDEKKLFRPLEKRVVG